MGVKGQLEEKEKVHVRSVGELKYNLSIFLVLIMLLVLNIRTLCLPLEL